MRRALRRGAVSGIGLAARPLMHSRCIPGCTRKSYLTTALVFQPLLLTGTLFLIVRGVRRPCPI